MAQQAKSEQFRCSGCGQSFRNRTDLEEHSKQCVELTKGSGRPKTQGAGGQSRQE